MRIGLVGYGHGGRFFHAPLIATLPSAADTRSMWEGVCTSIKE
jgi:predicted dehydrogenase